MCAIWAPVISSFSLSPNKLIDWLIDWLKRLRCDGIVVFFIANLLLVIFADHSITAWKSDVQLGNGGKLQQHAAKLINVILRVYGEYILTTLFRQSVSKNSAKIDK